MDHLLNKENEYFFHEAFKQAQLAFQNNEIPIGAVIVAENKIIAKGYNQVEQLQDPTAHAEILAITAATQSLGSKYLKSCTMYTTLEPCAMCASAISWSQLKRLFFAAQDLRKGYRNYSPCLLHPKTKSYHLSIFQEKNESLIKKAFYNIRNKPR